MYEVTSEVTFSAAHRLRNYAGPCENLHGHNWRVRASVRCETINELGIGIDFRTLREHLAAVVEPLDHSDINTVFDALAMNPSSENIARYIFEELRKRLIEGSCAVWRVEVYETPTNCAAYYGNA